MLKAIKIKAPAKINLGLKVLRRRPDGYHDICSVMQQLSLSDTVLLEPRHGEGWQFICTDPLLCVKENLVCRAADLLTEKAGRTRLPGVNITLYKNIPAGAGLGGGSSDAAAALKGLNHFWNLGLSPAQLLEAGALLGSDVPYCLQGGTALVQGRGEKLRALPPLPFHWAVLALPPDMLLSTAHVYSALEQEHLGGPSLVPLISALEAQSREMLQGWFAAGSTNTLEAVVSPAQPRLRALQERFIDLGLHPAMSGSGPSYFVLCDNLIHARTAARALLQEMGNRVFLCWTIFESDQVKE